MAANRKIIIAGGGTGGHIFPAVAIANEFKKRMPEGSVLFVGAEGGMEMSVVPKYGYDIKPVWISGIHRSLTLRNLFRNLLFPVKLMYSLGQARRIIREFQPELAVGVGGYASGPLSRVAAKKGIPLVLCEQNAYPGLVNRWLAPLASKILLGNPDARKYFDEEKVVVTGNPIREFDLPARNAAVAALELDPAKPVVLSLGGSLGAGPINRAWLSKLDQLLASEVQLVWQCGKRYYDSLRPQVPDHPQLRLMPFIEDMAQAYAAADLVVSRAGGSTISELIALSKPSILLPSPNVAEDHQTKNALSLVQQGAALMVKDNEAAARLVAEVLDVLTRPEALKQLKAGIAQVEKHQASKEIVDEIMELL